MRQIPPYALWLGNAGDGRQLKAVLDAGVKAVVQLAAEESPLPLPRDLILCRFPIVDGPGNDRKMLNLAISALANLIERRVPTLVCCGAGLSRSPAITAAALALVYQQPADDCLKKITEDVPADVAPALWLEVRDSLDLER